MKNAARRGVTLIELSIASFLLAILLSLTYLAMSEAAKKQNILRDDIALQQDALALLAKLSRETAEGHSATFWPDRTANSNLVMPGGEPVGFVFLSPRNATGRIELDPVNNRPIWQKRVCYYFDSATSRVYRCEEALATPSSTPPARDDTKTTQWFMNNVASDPVPGTIEAFSVAIGDNLEELQFDVTLSTERGRRKKSVQFLTSATLVSP